MFNYNAKTNEVYRNLKKYIETNIKEYSVNVVRNVTNAKFPAIVLSEIMNRDVSHTIDRRQNVRAISIQIDIYSVEMNGKSPLAISEEIKQLVMELMEQFYHMQGGYENRLYNVNDSNTLRTILRYNFNWFVERDVILNN